MKDAVVVGGGLAGLASATYLARAGWKVTVYEKSRGVGGRAVTTALGEFRFNLGPHALYVAGVGRAVLKELGVHIRGGRPSASGSLAIQGGRLDTLPVGPVSLLTTGLLSLGGKLELGRLLSTLPQIDTVELRRLTVAEWLESASGRQEVRELLAALVRVATYAHDPQRQGAQSAIAQLQRALKAGVLYLDGGWQTIVDGLRARAEAAGVRLETEAPVRRVVHDGHVRAVVVADGREHETNAVVATGSPAQVEALLPGVSSLHALAREAVPVRAASLDVALEGLPWRHGRFARGIDTPLYASVHSATARLAPPNGAVIQAAKYLGSEPAADPQAVRRELEAALDLLQPGWRPRVVHDRFLPDLVVSNALTTTAVRPDPAVPDVHGLFVAGDWVGEEGLLADATLASARAAARALLARAGAVPPWEAVGVAH
jgi:phytoene dehydrogenase-like protein